MPARCPVCGDEFSSEKGVRDHAWDVHGTCHYCTEPYGDRETLYRHWLDAHGGELSREDRKRAETKVGDRTVCPACDSRFGSESRVRDHAWDDHGVCHHCGDGFDDEEALYTHWLTAHDDDLSYAHRKEARAAVGPLSFGQRLSHQGPAAAVSELQVDRRTLMRGGAVGAIGAVGVVGGQAVLGGSGSGPGSGGGALGGHPATADIQTLPTLGPTPGEGQGTIVAFEDPSCPSCARFGLQTFPTLRSRLVEGNDVSFVFRGVPIVNSWGSTATEEAVLAMHATHVRDASAFWSLKEFYYRNQRRIGGGNVRSETRQFLAGETDVDAEAVVSDVDGRVHADAIQANVGAAQEAGVRGTPTFFLFRNGSYVTDIVGPQSTDVFASSLGV